MNCFNTPVLLIIWRRPHTLRQVINAIRPIAPIRLFVACDGPNPERAGEREKVAATRLLIEQEVDWPCHIERLYSDDNKGCRLGPLHAINWFFEHVEEGIILEDDCIPHLDFFHYCESLLERYREDSRVWCIGGSNFQSGQLRGKGSYYFSRYPHTWGWATWRRCWSRYDANIEQWPALRDSGLLSTIFDEPEEMNQWSTIWDRIYKVGDIDSWDYQWCFTCMVNSSLTALPNCNLVRNVGFDADATHTPYASAEPGSPARFVVDSSSTLPGLNGAIQHPNFLLRDAEADRFEFEHKLGGLAMRRQRQLHHRLINGLRRRLSWRAR